MLRDVRLGIVFPFACAMLAASACQSRDTPAVDSSSGLPANAPPVVAAPARSGPSSTTDVPLACATLRDVTTSDVVRVDGTTLFYAETSTGLTIVDVSDAGNPRAVANVPFVGTPLALFVREGIAWIVFVDFDARFAGPDHASTVVRALDVRTPSKPLRLGDEIRAGHARDAKLVGGVLYTLAARGAGSLVESFAVVRGQLQWLDRVALEGAPAQLAGTPAGLAAVTTFENRAEVTWLDLPLERPGTLVPRATVKTPGGVATWDRGDGRIVDADEGQRVRLVTCATRSCGPDEGATLRVLDFADTAPAHVSASLEITKRGGLPITRFANELLFVGETATSAEDTTLLHVVRTDKDRPRKVSTLALRGLVSGLVARDGSLVALGSTATASAESQVRIAVYDLDVRRPEAPRVRGSATFGSDWTWSPALDDENAMSFDPASNLVSVPFTAWRYQDSRYITGTQLVDLGRHGAQNLDSIPSDGFVERAVFLDGHLVTIGPKGIHGFEYGGARRPTGTERPLDLGAR